MNAELDFLERVDLFIFRLINSDWTHSYFDIFFPSITDLHKTLVFKLVFIPLILLLFFYWRRLNGLVVFSGLILSLALSDWVGAQIKKTVMRERPFETNIEIIQRSGAGGYSFPSNHAINMFCAAMFLSYFFPRYRWAFFVAATLVSFSRVYNGVHYPSDVLFGGLLGALFGYAGAKLTEKIIDKINSRKVPDV
jgi:undecaprenyl-diphosphatase